MMQQPTGNIVEDDDATSDGPAIKRQKAFTIFRDEASLEDSFRHLETAPFRHLLIPDVFNSDFLQSVIREIKDNSTVNYKESDLFRVFQSMDLANLNDHAKLPHVWELRAILYSKDWRRRIETAFGLEQDSLTEEIDCACNCHAEGCHLLCHDDVIGTRCISYILYLTEEDWKANEGGSLELFDRDDHQCPKFTPSKYVLPILNQLVCFKVEPTVSFHAVQEVRGSRPRLSLQGWYHTKEPPELKDLATLQRLKDKDETEPGFSFKELDCDLSNEDVTEESDLNAKDNEVLSAYIQQTYLEYASIKEIAERFEADSSVQLRNFLKDDVVKLLDLSDSDDKDLAPNTPEFDLMGVSDQWALVGPPHKQRFLEHKPGTNPSQLSKIRIDLMENPAFGRYLHLLTGLQPPTSCRGRTRRFRRGRDYTVAHYGQLLKDESVLDVTLCFVKDDEEVEQEQWQSGDVGGFECYIEADDEEDNAPADEYNEDDDTELLSVSASSNTLSLVYRDPGTMRFIKYIGSKAPSSRWDITMEYQVPPDEEGEVGEGDDKETGAEDEEEANELESTENPTNEDNADVNEGEPVGDEIPTEEEQDE